jgi:hypothetical protein
MRSNQFLVRAALATTALAASGCPARDIAQLPVGAAIEERLDIPVANMNNQLDILFVIDNSPSMADKQNTLAENFPRFIEVLQTIQGGQPDLHIGVVTSDVDAGFNFSDTDGGTCHVNGDDGLLQLPSRNCPAISLDNGQRFIADAYDGDAHRTNYTAGHGLAEVFSCMARVGDKGCGFEQHLEAMKLALDGSRLENAGFLRHDAYLAVIVLADEDDCSALDKGLFDPNPLKDNVIDPLGPAIFRCPEFGVRCDGGNLSRSNTADYENCEPRDTDDSKYLWHPQHYINFLTTAVKDDPDLLIGAVIVGDPGQPPHLSVALDEKGNPELQPSCTFDAENGDHEKAFPAVRLDFFARQFGDQGGLSTICQGNLEGAMTTIAKLLRRVVGTPCLDGPIDPTDIDPAMPGAQVDCQVSDVIHPGRADQTETVLPRCPMIDDATPDTSTVPCWWTTVDAMACKDTETHLALKVERGGDTPHAGTHVVARCVLK